MNQLVLTLTNGIIVSALYFVIASGFSLIFGVMRVINMAHGATYLAGGYLGWTVATHTGSWVLGLIAAPISMAIVGVVVQQVMLRHIQGDELRETLVTIGISIVVADLLLAIYGGLTYNFSTPAFLMDGFTIPGTSTRLTWLAVLIIAAAVLVGVGLSLLLSRTDLGRVVRAGIDDSQMVKSLGYRIQVIFALIFALGSALAGMAGVLGGSLYSLQPGADSNYLVSALLVVIIGGLGSLPGTALGALLVGLVTEIGLTYVPSYAQVLTFGLMALVLAFRPNGLLGRAA